MSSSQLKRLKELEKENSQLKKMYADKSLVHDALKDAFGQIRKYTGTIKLDETVHIGDFNQNGIQSSNLKGTFNITKSFKVR